MNMLGLGIPVVLLVLGLTPTTCQRGGERQLSTPGLGPVPALELPAPPRSALDAAQTTSVLVYVKVAIDKKYGVLAHLLGGMRDSTWQRTRYDAANPWWKNPLIVHADAPFAQADVIGRADAEVMTGQGASGNVAVRATVVPHADVAVKTIPRSDGMKGTITAIMSTAAEYYDGGWAEMIHVDDRKVTFSFDTCDPLRRLEVVKRETRTISTFALERYTRDETRWEPKSAWPGQAKSGDWRVVIYGKDATLEVTTYRYVEPSVAGAER